MLEGEMDAIWDIKRVFMTSNNSGNLRNSNYPKKIKTEHGKTVITIPLTAMASLI